jgi:hypothetical protein
MHTGDFNDYRIGLELTDVSIRDDEAETVATNIANVLAVEARNTSPGFNAFFDGSELSVTSVEREPAEQITQTNIQTSLEVTPEGISVSLEAVFEDQQPIVVDETWLAWAEIIRDGAENWAQAEQLQGIERVKRTLTANSEAVQETTDD